MRTERANPKIEEERKAAGNAKAILGWLTPSNARTDRLIFVLRNAANVATTATLTRLESKKALDALRDEAANSLNAVCGLLDRGALTREVIDQANRAVSMWVDALPVGRRQSPDERRGPGGLRRKLKEPSSAGQSPAASLCSQRTTSDDVSNRASFIPSVCQKAHVHVKQNTTYEYP